MSAAVAALTRKPLVLAFLAVLLATGAYEINRIRREVGGMHNLTSREYWASRMNGTDLYNPETMFFKRGSRDNKEVCLTFDDGPHPASCQPILNILKEYDAHATFFLVGKRIKEHPELARAILESGQEVGNHTQDHLRLDTLRLDQVDREMLQCEENFYKATKRHMKLFRPPGMRYNDEIMGEVMKLGYTTVGWNVGAKDFVGANLQGKKQSPELIADSVLKQLENGVIILLHDNPETAEALPTILSKLHDEGYKVLNATEMMSHLPKPVTIASNAE